MRVAVIGGGPASLYFAYLLKRENVANRVQIFERNPRDATSLYVPGRAGIRKCPLTTRDGGH